MVLLVFCGRVVSPAVTLLLNGEQVRFLEAPIFLFFGVEVDLHGVVATAVATVGGRDTILGEGAKGLPNAAVHLLKGELADALGEGLAQLDIAPGGNQGLAEGVAVSLYELPSQCENVFAVGGGEGLHTSIPLFVSGATSKDSALLAIQKY